MWHRRPDNSFKPTPLGGPARFRRQALLGVAMSSPVLTFLVLRARDLECTARFYAELGFTLVPEQHGSGPAHYSCQTGSVVLEIYPAGSSGAEPGTGMFGFTVASMPEALRSVQAFGGSVISEMKRTQRGIRAVVLDPDGRKLELLEA